MKQKTTNTFGRGMNQDMAFTRFNAEQYFKGLNVRPTTDEMGASTGSLASIKGNALDFTIPDVGNTWRIVVDETFIDTYLDGTAQILDLTIHGQNQQVPFQSTEVQALYEIIATSVNTGMFGGLPIAAQSKESGVIIYSTDFSLIGGVTSTNTGTVITQDVVQSTGLRVIGSTELRDSIVLFTAPTISNGTGQVWEVTWDEFDVPTLRLVRNGADKLSADFPIEAVSRYEAGNIRRVYWTDNNNAVRSLNIDSDSAYLDTVGLIPATEFDAPIPTEINQAGGSLTTGHYAATYRLKALGGSETSYSQFSPLIRISTPNEATEDYIDYQGSSLGAATSKSLTFKIENIDANFTNIDIVIATYTATDVEYYLIQEEFDLTGATEYEFTVSSLDPADLITIEDFLLQPAVFATAKTLTIKDNRLLAGNIKDIDLTLEDYDAHAFRYDGNGDTDGYELTTDKRNKYNRDSTRADVSADQQKYQSDGTTLGGEGTNISFKFITEDINLDDLGGTGDQPAPRFNTQTRVTVTGKSTSKVLNNRTLPMGGYWNNYKNPFVEAWYKGYMRAEIYRFAIVFFDLKGRPAAAKWIADIRMPEFYDVPSHVQTSGSLIGKVLGVEFTVNITDEIRDKFSGYSIVRAERTGDDATLFGQGLVGDTENLTLFSDGSDGLKNGSNNGLIRADRLMAYGETNIGMTFKTTDSPEFKLGSSRDVNGTKLRPILGAQVSHTAIMDTNDIGDPHNGDHGAYAKYYGTNSSYTYRDNDASDNISSLSLEIDGDKNIAFSNSPIIDGVFSSNGIDGLLNYQHRIDGEGHQTINDAQFGNNQMRFRQKATASKIYHSESCFTTYTLGNRIIPAGSIATNGNWVTGPNDRTSGRADVNLANTGTYGRRLLANFYRELTNQYGGDTLSAINNTIYISTGHYQGFKKSDSTNTFTSSVYGGDTFICIYDESHGMANHDVGAAAGNPFVKEDEARMSSHIMPIESRINVDLRVGLHFSTIGNSAVGGTTSNVINFFIPNDVFNYASFQGQQNDLYTFKSLTAFRNNVIEFDNRVYASDAKINGEPGDSWTSFKLNNFIDVDGNHGAINKLITFNDTVFYFQDSAYGMLSVNPRVAVQGSDDVQIELGTGGILHAFNYYSTTVGTKHQWSVFQSPTAVYWFNITNKKAYKHAGGLQELTDIKGMHSFFADSIDSYLGVKDNPLLRTGILGTYDFIHQEAIFSFLTPKDPQGSPVVNGPDDFTIAFSEALQTWSSFYSFYPTHYLSNKARLLTPDSSNLNSIYIHSKGEYAKFYDIFNKIELDMVVSQHPTVTKVFDAVSFHTNARNENNHSIDQKTFETYNAYTDYQHTSPIVLTPDVNLKRKEREWQMAMPRNAMSDSAADLDLFDPANYDLLKEFKDRMRDKYIVQQFDLLGSTGADQFIINYINTYFRVSAR